MRYVSSEGDAALLGIEVDDQSAPAPASVASRWWVLVAHVVTRRTQTCSPPPGRAGTSIAPSRDTEVARRSTGTPPGRLHRHRRRRSRGQRRRAQFAAMANRPRFDLGSDTGLPVGKLI
jgi:hypothetical protein